MIRYDVFTRTSGGRVHYGSRRRGVTSSSRSFGLGTREVAEIVSAHGLEPGDLIHSGGNWILLTSVGTSLMPRTPLSVEYRFLSPTMEDTDLVFGGESWSPQMVRRLLQEAYSMVPEL
jgi:hypothetical protein